MPELPEVETIKESMRQSVCGAKIESVVIYNRHLRIDIPSDFEHLVCQAKIQKIYRLAKYAVMELNNGYSIIWHFGMSGKVKINQQTNPPVEKHDHVVINTSSGSIVYNDPRRFGLICLSLSSKIDHTPFFKHLGPDPFSTELTIDYLKDRFKQKRTPIKPALLDQSVISGIGNIYASEALYEAGISPFRLCYTLTPDELKKLISAIQKTLNKAIAAGGSTLHDYRKPDGNIGYFQLQHQVYGKDGQNCPKCKDVHGCIQKVSQCGRSTYYCANTQK